MAERRECLLQRALDAHERCPGAECPFFEGWQPYRRLDIQVRR